MFENIPVVELAIGRSTVRQRILALLMSESAGRLHLREIQRRACTSPGTASRELAKLVAAGLIEREAEGAQVYFHASASPFAAMMRSLLIIAPGPPDALPRPTRLARPKKSGPKPTESAASTASAAEQAIHSRDSLLAPATIDPSPTVTDSGLINQAQTDPTNQPARPGSVEQAAEAAPPRVFRPAVPDAVKPAWLAVPELKVQSAAERAHTADPFGLQIARRLAESVESLYAESGRLRGVYLYGERAGGSTRPDADVEMLIVLDRVDRYGAELERTSHLCAALSHEHKLVISRVFVSESDWLGRNDGSLTAIRAAAVEI